MTHLYNARFLNPHAMNDLASELATIETYAEALPRLVAKASHRLIRIEQIGATEAMILKQELLALGGDALISPAIYLGQRDGTTDAIIFASRRQLDSFVHRCTLFPLEGLQRLADEIQTLLHTESADRGTLKLAEHTWTWGARTYIMGIINCTPDSFSADGLLQPGIDTAETALAQAQRLVHEGADIIDIGGESTRPGASIVSPDEERQRIIAAISAIAATLPIPISVDSYHAEVVAAALDAGAHLINDVWGLRTPDGTWNEPLAALAHERAVPIILMHNRRASHSSGTIGGHYPTVAYNDLLGDIIAGLRDRIEYALSHGIPREHIIVDPGLGFGKTPEQNMLLLRRLHELQSLGFPLLIGASRKSFIGLPLSLPPQARDEGTAAVTALAIQAGADIIRVHNVQMNLRAARLTDAIVRGKTT